MQCVDRRHRDAIDSPALELPEVRTWKARMEPRRSVAKPSPRGYRFRWLSGRHAAGCSGGSVCWRRA
jgi:hypothetical protein